MSFSNAYLKGMVADFDGVNCTRLRRISKTNNTKILVVYNLSA